MQKKSNFEAVLREKRKYHLFQNEIRMIKILLLTDYSLESERRFLNGFVKYTDTQGGCIFYPMSHLVNEDVDHSMEIIRFAKTFKVDAILGLWHNINEEEAKKLNIPIFF